MKFLIKSTTGDAKEYLEKLGFLAEPSEYSGYYFINLDSLEDLIGLIDIIETDVVIQKKRNSNKFKSPLDNYIVIEIYNDYRE